MPASTTEGSKLLSWQLQVSLVASMIPVAVMSQLRGVQQGALSEGLELKRDDPWAARLIWRRPGSA